MASDQGKRRRGGIRERAGVYQVRVYVGLDPVTGERVDLAGTAATEREAEKLLTQFLAEKDARRAARSRITVGDACDRMASQPRCRGEDPTRVRGLHTSDAASRLRQGAGRAPERIDH